MKTMKLNLILALFFAQAAFAQSELKSEGYNGSYTGTVTAAIQANWYFESYRINPGFGTAWWLVRQSSSLGLNLVVKKWGDGKLKVIFMTDELSQKDSKRKYGFNCPKSLQTYVGYQDATDTFNLFKIVTPSSIPTPDSGEPDGQLAFDNGNAFLNFYQASEIWVGGNGVAQKKSLESDAGACLINISKDNAIELKQNSQHK